MTITIDGTSGIASVDGSAGSPSVRGSDANSGIVYAADTVALSTAGSERMRVDSNGNVGIGTTSPGGFKLKVEGGDSDEGLFVHTGASSSQWLIRAEDNAANQRFVVKSTGEVLLPSQPRFCIIGGSNMYNATESKIWDGSNFAPNNDGGTDVNGGNTIHVNVGSHYTESNGRWTVPVAGTYYFFFFGTSGSNSSHFVQITKNGSGVSGDLGLEYSDGSDHQNVGGSIMTTCAVGDYFHFRRRGSGYRFYSLVWGGWLIA